MKQTDYTKQPPQASLHKPHIPLFYGSQWRLTHSKPALGENDTAYVLTLDMPGFKEGDFHFSVANGIANIIGETFQGGYYSFRKSFPLPDDVEKEQISISYDERGPLRIILPKKGNNLNNKAA